MLPDRAPAPSPSQVSLSADELADVLRKIVRSEVSDSQAQAVATKPFGLWAKVKLVAASLSAAGVLVAAVVTFIYSRGQAAEADGFVEKDQNRRILVNEQGIETQRGMALAQQAQIRNLGALQIEQGNDQRAMLLEGLPESSKKKHKNKPDKLKAAEGAVLRD